MCSRPGCSLWLFALSAVLCGVPGTLRAQNPLPPAPTFRPLAPGVLTVIPTAEEAGETANGPVPIVEIVKGIPDLDWTPNYEAKTQTLLEKAKSVTFHHAIWNLEFAFKPLRMIEIEIPQPSGRMQRKQIYYLVYRVKNAGYDLNPVAKEGVPGLKTHDVERVNFAYRTFIPHFVLESHEFKKQYLDRIIPAAKKPIQDRERPGVELYNSVEITNVRIPLSDDRNDRSVWGFVTWEDLDPRIDFFSIYVRGLTNAMTVANNPAAFKAGSPPGTGREFTYKTLQLNFWRPGDTQYAHERELHYGVPIESDPAEQQGVLDKYGLKRRLDYQWVYR